MTDGEQKPDGAPPAEKPGEKPPESVSWSKYVGVKESFEAKLHKAEQEKADLAKLAEQSKGEVQSLSEKLKSIQSTHVPKEELEKANSRLGEIEKANFDARKIQVAEAYGMSQDKAAELTKEDVQALEKAIKLGVKPRSKVDVGGGSSSSGPVSAFDKISAGLSELRK